MKRLRRWVAIAFLCMTAVYLGAASVDCCSDGPTDPCAPLCHMLCSDGCATAPVPEAPVPPPSDPLPRPRYSAERVEHLVTLTIEPEKEPPRS